jgi:hypothetical protein
MFGYRTSVFAEEGLAMDERSDQVCPFRNARFLKERQEWLKLYRSTCQQIGGRRWRQNKRDELLAKVESQLWQVMRAKGMHHMSFRRKCQMAQGIADVVERYFFWSEGLLKVLARRRGSWHGAFPVNVR